METISPIAIGSPLRRTSSVVAGDAVPASRIRIGNITTKRTTQGPNDFLGSVSSTGTVYSEAMPNLPYMLVSLVHDSALAIWIGGILVLGALVAPTLFGSFERRAAGEAFGTMLRRFLRLRLVAVVALILAAGVRFALWESPGRVVPSIWIMMRWTLISTMALMVLYELLYLERAVERSLAGMRANGEEGEEGRRFRVLHRRSEMLAKASLLTATGALFLS